MYCLALLSYKVSILLHIQIVPCQLQSDLMFNGKDILKTWKSGLIPWQNVSVLLEQPGPKSATFLCGVNHHI